jgi:hypothetical protein
VNDYPSHLTSAPAGVPRRPGASPRGAHAIFFTMLLALGLAAVPAATAAVVLTHGGLAELRIPDLAFPLWSGGGWLAVLLPSFLILRLSKGEG